MKMSSTLADQLKVIGIDDDLIHFTDHSLGFGFEIVAKDLSCLDDGQVNGLSRELKTFLNGIPSGVSMQFIQEIGQEDPSAIERHLSPSEIRSESLAQSLAEDRCQRLLKLNAQSQIPTPKHWAFFRIPPQGAAKKPSRASALSINLPKSDARKERALRLKAEFLRSLNGLGFSPQPLSPKRLFHLLYRQWNPMTEPGKTPVDLSDIRSRIAQTDLVTNPLGFSLGAKHYRVLSLKELPDHTHSGLSEKLVQLPFNSRLIMSIQAPDQGKEIEKLYGGRRIAFSMQQSKGGVRDLESEAKFQDLESTIEEVIAGGEKIFLFSMSVILYADDPKKLDEMVSETSNLIRNLNGAEPLVETYAALPIFLESAIPNACVKERGQRIKSSNLADLIPVYGPQRGHERPSILLRSHFGSLFSVDPFDPSLPNANQIISGGSGSGKSYLTNIMMLHMLKDDPEIYIIDIGGSYKKFTEAIGGQYVAFGDDQLKGINPFDLRRGVTAPAPGKVKFLVGLVENMLTEQGQTRLPRLWRAEIEDAVLAVYQKAPNPRLSDLRDHLAGHFDSEIKKIARSLGPWCGDSPYGRFIDRPSAINLERRIVCFDLKGLESHPDLQAICLNVITDFVWRKIQENPTKIKFVIFDECWKLMENPATAGFVGEIFRTVRKYQTSAIAISQTIDDFANSLVAEAILPNSAVKWVLKQKGANIKRMAEILRLNEQETSLIQGLSQERGHFSQAFLIAEDQRAVVNIEASPLEYWIATTDPRDRAELERMGKAKPDASELSILTELAQTWPNGVSQAPDPRQSANLESL